MTPPRYEELLVALQDLADVTDRAFRGDYDEQDTRDALSQAQSLIMRAKAEPKP